MIESNATAKRTTPLYQRLSALLLQRENCAKAVPRNDTWFDIATSRIIELVREFMPSGSGFDNGTELDLDRSTSEKLVFVTAFHHMDEHGCYDGWTNHLVTVRGSLWDKFTLTISGRDRHDVKGRIHDLFYEALREQVEEA